MYQFADVYKWEAQIKNEDSLLHTHTFKVQSKFTLERYIQKHRSKYISMQSCTEHVRYQLLNKHTHVGYVLGGTEMSDAPLLAAMSNIQEDTVTTGKRNKFDYGVTYLLPKDPVSKHCNNSNKCNHARIYDTYSKVQVFGSKFGIVK